MTDQRNDCEECGFADESVTVADAVAALRGFGRRYRAPLTRFLPGEDGDAVVRERPEPGVWSALEYAAHVGEVFAWYDQWIRRSLVEDDPVIVAPTPDEAAGAGAYNEADPTAVADAVAASAEVLAATLEGIPEEAWSRCHVRRGESRSVLFAARRAVHEGNHHLLDIGRGMRAVRQRRRTG
ncbi:MAG TPA: DinB family protein [Acidimicrobiales bacterium]|nr:DinB family protein [Acidimicrobiales bacterium]